MESKDNERARKASRCLVESRDLLDHLQDSEEDTQSILFETGQQLHSKQEATEETENSSEYWTQVRGDMGEDE